MSGKGDRSHSSEVVNPVKRWLRAGKVKATEEKVDLVGVSGSKRLGKLVADPCCRRTWSQFDVVSAGVKRFDNMSMVKEGGSQSDKSGSIGRTGG